MTSGDIRISAERIDGSRCKFLVSVPVHAGGVRRFASAEEASGSPLAAAIFAIPAAEVAEIIVSGNLVTVGERGPAPRPAPPPTGPPPRPPPPPAGGPPPP